MSRIFSKILNLLGIRGQPLSFEFCDVTIMCKISSKFMKFSTLKFSFEFQFQLKLDVISKMIMWIIISIIIFNEPEMSSRQFFTWHASYHMNQYYINHILWSIIYWPFNIDQVKWPIFVRAVMLESWAWVTKSLKAKCRVNKMNELKWKDVLVWKFYSSCRIVHWIRAPKPSDSPQTESFEANLWMNVYGL